MRHMLTSPILALYGSLHILSPPTFQPYLCYARPVRLQEVSQLVRQAHLGGAPAAARLVAEGTEGRPHLQVGSSRVQR